MKGTRITLVWDEWNTEHIKKHSVTTQEVEEAVQSSKAMIASYNNRTLFLGKANNNRLLTVVCSQEKQPEYYVVSARDMSKKERKIYEKN